MRIGIDASRAFLKQRTGIEEYSYQVIKHLINKLKDRKVILYTRKKPKINFALPQNWKIKVIKFSYLWTQLGLSLEMLIHPIDVLFVPSHTVPIIHPKNTFVTIHGLEYEKIPKAYSFWERFYMRLSIKFSCRWAKRIIAVSKNTRDDLVELYKVPENKIEVIYEGTDLATADNSFKFQVSSFKPYLLFIGRLEKRKNVEGIIEAYEILKEKYKIPHSLILVGSRGYGWDSIKHKVESIKHKKNIILTGFVSETEKYNLLKKADVFLFPSFYEGFGLPVLESQSMGVPVVTSNTSALLEITKDSAAYADPYEPIAIADAAYWIISNREYREDMIKRGYENAKRFSWEKCASEIAEILKEN